MSSPELANSNVGGATRCIHHPHLRAAFVCAACGQPICSLCAFSRADGTRICPQCASSPSAHGESAPPIVSYGDAPPANVQALKCVQHPDVSAVHVCKGCGAPVCAICDFLLPGNFHLCPKCVAAPPKRMARARKISMVSAYVFAAYGTLALSFVMSGALARMARTRGDLAMIDIIFSVFVFVPSMIGAALGISCIDPRLRNPVSVWVAAIWNSLLLVIHIILNVLGNLRH